MKRSARLLAAIALSAASPVARSQPTVTYSVSWTEVQAGTSNPVPIQNGQIDPGEGARIAIAVTISPGIGSSVIYTPPPPPGIGTLAGFGSMFLDILGTNLNGGTWANITRNPGGMAPNGVINNWTIGGPGTGQSNGNFLNAQAGQWPLPGSTANNSNPVVNIWRGTWWPSSYELRNVSLATAPADAASGNHSSVLVQYGTSPIGAPEYVYQYVAGVFGGTAMIPIVPSPGTLGLMLMAMFGAGLAATTYKGSLMKLIGLVAPLALAAAAGTAAGQQFVTYSLTWSEVLAGTNVPVTAPNGMIEPGEGVRLAMRVAISPGIGATMVYTPPPPPGVGTIAGFGSLFLDILGTNLNVGTWSSITRDAAANPGGVPGGHNWSLGDPGSPQPNGSLINIGAGQFILPGGTAVSANPVDNIWRGTWTPSTYVLRTASFRPAAAVPSGGTNHSSLLLQYGLSGGGPQYVGIFVPAVFNSTGGIPIVPAPAGAALLGLAAVVARRRRS